MVSSLSEVLTSLQSHWCDAIRENASICLKTLLLRVERTLRSLHFLVVSFSSCLQQTFHRIRFSE